MISILMGTYNGQAYIAEQVKSILDQSHQDFVLHINDDVSTDQTFDIAQQFASEFPEKITVTQNPVNSGCAKHNFIDLMIRIKDDYVMLCDQDDVWLPDKIELTLKEMQKMEFQYGSSTPILVHSDLRVVSEDLSSVISPSFRKAMGADYTRVKLREQIIQNTLTGCTAMYNRSLANMIEREPEFMVMHDWWLMLMASAFGKIGVLDNQTVLYRQHNNNVVGAFDVRTLSYKINKLRRFAEIKKALNETYLQAGSFLNSYKYRLTNEQIQLLETYCQMPNMNKLMRWQTLCRLGTWKHGLSRKIACFLYI